MEQLLRGWEAPEIGPVDFSGPLFFFPVRHHSPACSWHLLKALERYEPDCILVEGPRSAQELIPSLAHPDTKAPVALYYFYKDQKGLVSGDKSDYRCYYPFLDTSPELVALRTAREKGIPARFIDLPYGEILMATAAARGLRSDGEKQVYSDDHLLSCSRFFRLLCEKTGMRTFGEFWEKAFEMDGLFLETEAFLHRMLLYCALTRQYASREELEEEGCLARERFMAQGIAEAAAQHRRVFVVTGGFHTSGLRELLAVSGERVSFSGQPVKLHSVDRESEGAYPLAYSMEATDALNGYASGMESPGFYQRVWEELCQRQEPSGAWEAAVLHQLAQTARHARQKGEALSSYDAACALSMAQGLAALRGKREPGLYELRDAALSAFVKGEWNLSTDLPLELLRELNTGSRTGRLCEGALRPPILGDFEERCREYRLKIQSSIPQETVLELFSKERHMELSRFFYRMEFLDTGFARRKKGADLMNRRDQNRIRELWEYRYTGKVLSALVDVSVSGGTVEEAARAKLLARFAKSAGAREAALLLTQGFLMGFFGEQARMLDRMKCLVAQDGDFFSLAQAFSHLRMLFELRQLYQSGELPELRELLESCFQKLSQMLPLIGQVAGEQQEEAMKACLSLYQLTGRRDFTRFRPPLMEAFERLIRRGDVSPGLEGAVLGLLYGSDHRYHRDVWSAAMGYLLGSREARGKSAAFLRGLFYTARDYVFAHEEFLSAVDALIGRLTAEEFLALLPELRMAFGYFTPMETDRLARKAAALHGAQRRELLESEGVEPLVYEYGEELDAWAVRQAEEGER